MIFDFLTPPFGGAKKCAVAGLIHVSNSHTKFGLISSNGLGEDTITHGRTEEITISPSLIGWNSSQRPPVRLPAVHTFRHDYL